MVVSGNSAEFLAAVSRLSAERDLLVARRPDGLPLKHLIGWVEFAGIRLDVDIGVSVPPCRHSCWSIPRRVCADSANAG